LIGLTWLLILAVSGWADLYR